MRFSGTNIRKTAKISQNQPKMRQKATLVPLKTFGLKFSLLIPPNPIHTYCLSYATASDSRSVPESLRNPRVLDSDCDKWWRERGEGEREHPTTCWHGAVDFMGLIPRYQPDGMHKQGKIVRFTFSGTNIWHLPSG